jgi:hypothetical protein
VLPLLRNQLVLFFSPGGIWVQEVKRGISRSAGRQYFIKCQAQTGDAPWRVALDVLGRSMKELENGKAETTVVLSNHFVEYALVPWNEQVSGKDEGEIYVRNYFSKVYGDAAETWDFRYCKCGAEDVMLASAIDKTLLISLREVMNSSKVKLSSVQPYLVYAFNRICAGMENISGWFVLVEYGKACVGLLHAGKWSRLRNLRIEDNWFDDLPGLIQREACLAGEEAAGGKVYVLAPEHVRQDWPAQGGWQFQYVALPVQQRADSTQHGGFSHILID